MTKAPGLEPETGGASFHLDNLNSFGQSFETK